MAGERCCKRRFDGKEAKTLEIWKQTWDDYTVSLCRFPLEVWNHCRWFTSLLTLPDRPVPEDSEFSATRSTEYDFRGQAALKSKDTSCRSQQTHPVPPRTTRVNDRCTRRHAARHPAGSLGASAPRQRAPEHWSAACSRFDSASREECNSGSAWAASAARYPTHRREGWRI